MKVNFITKSNNAGDIALAYYYGYYDDHGKGDVRVDDVIAIYPNLEAGQLATVGYVTEIIDNPDKDLDWVRKKKYERRIKFDAIGFVKKDRISDANDLKPGQWTVMRVK